MENGKIKLRKSGLGGMKDRLVNGYQFGKMARRRSWPIIMENQGISELDVYWYDTETDAPNVIEKELLEEVEAQFGKLPPWNSRK